MNHKLLFLLNKYVANSKEKECDLDIYENLINDFLTRLRENQKVSKNELGQLFRKYAFKGGEKGFEQLVQKKLVLEGIKFTPLAISEKGKIEDQYFYLYFLFRSILQHPDRKLVKYIGDIIIRKGIDHEMLTLVRQTSMHLSLFSSVAEIDHFNRYADIFSKYNKASGLLGNLFLLIYKRNYYLNKKKLDVFIPSLEKELLEIKSDIQQSDFLAHHISMNALHEGVHWHNKNYEDLIENNENTLLLLHSKKNIHPRHIVPIYQNIGIGWFYLAEYEKALEAFNKAESLGFYGTYGVWGTTFKLKFIVFIYMKNYEEARKVVQNYTKNSKFHTEHGFQKEEWNIILAWNALLFKLDKLEELPSQNQVKEFRINRFLNEVPEYSKIKWSNNAVVLILHFCHLIADKKYNQAIERLEALEKYSARHLRKKNESFRLFCFLKMLLEIPKAGFHRAGVERKAAKYRAKLDEVSIADTRQQIMIEVIPFEDLWDMILDTLVYKHTKLW